MIEAKKKPPLALVALAPLAGVYSLIMPYLYWRAAVYLWGPAGETPHAATCGAVTAQFIAVVAFCVWRGEQK